MELAFTKENWEHLQSSLKLPFGGYLQQEREKVNICRHCLRYLVRHCAMKNKSSVFKIMSYLFVNRTLVVKRRRRSLQELRVEMLGFMAVFTYQKVLYRTSKLSKHFLYHGYMVANVESIILYGML